MTGVNVSVANGEVRLALALSGDHSGDVCDVMAVVYLTPAGALECAAQLRREAEGLVHRERVEHG